MCLCVVVVIRVRQQHQEQQKGQQREMTELKQRNHQLQLQLQEQSSSSREVQKLVCDLRSICLLVYIDDTTHISYFPLPMGQSAELAQAQQREAEMTSTVLDQQQQLHRVSESQEQWRRWRDDAKHAEKLFVSQRVAIEEELDRSNTQLQQKSLELQRQQQELQQCHHHQLQHEQRQSALGSDVDRYRSESQRHQQQLQHQHEQHLAAAQQQRQHHESELSDERARCKEEAAQAVQAVQGAGQEAGQAAESRLAACTAEAAAFRDDQHRRSTEAQLLIASLQVL